MWIALLVVCGECSSGARVDGRGKGIGDGGPSIGASDAVGAPEFL